MPASAAPLRPAFGRGAVRRAPPAVAAPLMVLTVVVAIVAGALLLAALPGGGPSGVGFASPTQRPTARATAQPTARPTATVKPQATPVATPVATPATATGPKPAGPGALDVCDPFFSVACGLDAGTYEPTHFVPAIRLKIGRGWSVADSRSEVLALTRDEGRLTFMSGITNVYPSGDPARAPATARLLVEAFIETDGVAAGKPADRKIDKHRATTVDLGAEWYFAPGSLLGVGVFSFPAPRASASTAT